MALVSHSVIQGVLVIGWVFFAALHLEIAKYSYLQNISFNMECLYSGEMLLDRAQRRTAGKMKSTKYMQPE